MLKLILLLLAVIFVTGENDSANDIEYDLDFFVNSDDIELDDGPLARFAPIGTNEKVFAIVATAQLNWFAAQQVCSFRGLTLASVNSQRESEDLRRYLYDNGLDSGKNYWLSGTDLASDDNWTWFSTGRPLIFDNFARDVTTTPSYDGATAEHCLLLRPDGKWLKERCDTQAYFICENRCALSSYIETL